ncbi:putative major facilitator superfamily transporter [Rosellinia necatrix]|uniref:Putative major facilitator superfamily transporter n=1 Tax=Rosellinia necatrix TaxID=77044 RepID=A0A1W2TR82_ROSNE|nr:putative major facilitator superfamily transporter [Rosellinia necatrix]
MGEAAENTDPLAMSSAGEDGKSLTEGEDMAPQRSRAESIWPAENISFPREFLVVFVACMAQFCTQASFASALLLLHTIGGSFDVTDPGQLAWLVAGYSLTVGTFILFSGRLGDAFGYKHMLLIGFVWFAVWSVVVGLSVYSNYTLIVFARVLQGIGPAICLPNALAILGSVYPPGHRKAMVFAFFGAVAPVGAIIGSAVASALSLVWWPWAFWALGIWLVVLAVLGHVVIPEPPQKPSPFADGYTWQRLNEELDLPGAVTGVISLVLFNFAWNQAPIVGWATAETIVPLVLGLLIFGVFVWIEVKFAAKPLLPFSAVNGDVAFVLGTVACGWATFGIWILYLVQILQEVRHLSPLLTVAWLAPLAIAGTIAAIITGMLLGPFQVRPPVVMTLALAAFTIGIILVATVPPDQIYWGQIFVCTIIIPFGMDMSFPAATLILSDAVKREHQGIGASLVNTIVNYSISLGVGFAGTVEVHTSRGDQLAGYRGGLYLGVGLSGLGLGICLVFLLREHLIKR